MKAVNICQLLLDREKQDRERIYLRQPKEGKWHEWTWGQALHQARLVANFLLKKGLKPGAHVAIYSKNCAEWFITDFGITLAGMVNVPLFANQHEDSIRYILNHAEIQLVFIGKLDKPHQIGNFFPPNLHTVSFDYLSDLETDFTWQDVLSGEPLQQVVDPKPEAVYTIIYSSGTSGAPKGAVYTHDAITRYLQLFPLDIKRIAAREHYRFLSYLPLAHVYERSAVQLGSLALSSDVSFVESLDTFAVNLREVKPNLFAAVPRVWGVFQHKIEQKISPGLLKWLVHVPVVSNIIKNKIKHQLGLSESAANISGAAHLPIPIYDFFEQLNIPILEGYGQTENFAYATLSLPGESKPGYVGTPRLEVEVKIGEHEELLIKCPCLMKEYYKEEQATRKAFTEDGWLRSGDIAEIDSFGRIKILGRLSENFKNQKGEFIAPTPIEKAFAANSLIEGLCLVGRKLPSNVLIVTLTKEAKKLTRNVVNDSLCKTLHEVNQELKSYEKIRHIIIAKEEWTPENELLTPTLKVKRRGVEEHYDDLIQTSFANAQIIIWEKSLS